MPNFSVVQIKRKIDEAVIERMKGVNTSGNADINCIVNALNESFGMNSPSQFGRYAPIVKRTKKRKTPTRRKTTRSTRGRSTRGRSSTRGRKRS